MWSGPRNISTAMMRSWENRSDTSVVDEPFYAYYLNKTQSPHPGFNDVLASQPHDYEEVVTQLTVHPVKTRLQYQKLMTHHMLPGVDLSWTKHLRHCFLIRDPAQVVASYWQRRGTCSVEDIGILRQAELYQKISELTDHTIPVIDSNDVLCDPDRVLGALCDELGIPFESNMLSWPAGPRDSDGIWAPHWYANVEKSTNFGVADVLRPSLTAAQEAIVEQVQSAYDGLYAQRLN